MLTEPRVVRDIVGRISFAAPTRSAGWITQRQTARQNADAPGQRLFQRFQPILSMTGNHQYAITDIAVDIHLLVDELHASVVQQVYLESTIIGSICKSFAGHRVTVDNIERQLRQNGGDNDNLVDVGSHGFHRRKKIRASTLVRSYRFHDPLTFTPSAAGLPDARLRGRRSPTNGWYGEYCSSERRHRRIPHQRAYQRLMAYLIGLAIDCRRRASPLDVLRRRW